MPQHQRHSLFMSILSIVSGLVLLTACTSQQTVSSTSSTKESLYIINTTGGNTEIKNIVTFQTGSNSSQHQLTLPAGLFFQNHKKIISALPQEKETIITITDTQTGKPLNTFTITGTYSTTRALYTDAQLSADGRWLALREVPSGEQIVVIDTENQKLVKTLHPGNQFFLDAISPQGDIVYLLQYLPNDPGHYYVRAYNLQQDALIEQIVADKSELNDPRMIGSAVARETAQDGRFAYTLYVDTTHNIAFVHILPLQQGNGNPPYLARCIDLPTGQNKELLRYYTLAMSADGQNLYAVNGALGLVNRIALKENIFDITEPMTAHFTVPTLPVNPQTPALHRGAIFSPDQQTLYFVGQQGIWAADTKSLAIQKHYLTQSPFTSIAFSTDQHLLYAAYPGHKITVLNTVAGQASPITASEPYTPWGIAWIQH